MRFSWYNVSVYCCFPLVKSLIINYQQSTNLKNKIRTQLLNKLKGKETKKVTDKSLNLHPNVALPIILVLFSTVAGEKLLYRWQH